MWTMAYATESGGCAGKMTGDTVLAGGVLDGRSMRSVWWDLCSVCPCSEVRVLVAKNKFNKDYMLKI